MLRAAKGKDALFGARLFFVTPGATKGRVKLVVVQRLLQALGFHDVGVDLRAMGKGVDAHGQTLGVLVHQELEIVLRLHAVAKGVHLPKLPARVHVQQRKRQLGRVKRLERQVQHHGAVFANRVQHDRVVAAGHHLAHDVDAFRFQALKVGEQGGGRGAAVWRGQWCWGWWFHGDAVCVRQGG